MTRSRLVVVVGAVLAVVLVVGVVASLAGRSSAPQVTTTAGPPATECVAEPGAEQSDVDTDDSDEFPWARVPGQKAVVYFETAGLPDRYARMVETGAQMWSRGACVEAIAVPRCPSGANCSTVEATPRGGGRDTDGESSGTQRDGVRVANAITLYTDLLDESSDNGALVTVVHEMGHALGLRHRNESDAMMNATTGNDTDPNPDAVDFANLVVLYGAPEGVGQ